MYTISEYISSMKSVFNHLPQPEIERVVDVLLDAWLERRQVFIMGNGGSASTSSHFACDLGKNTRTPGVAPLRVSSLTDNMALFSAFANDEGYDSVFAGPLANLHEPRDVVICISASGNSPNVLRAAELSNKMGGFTIGLTGFDGGKLAGMVDLNVHINCDCIEQVEDIHLMVCHMVTVDLRERVRKMAKEIVTSVAHTPEFR